MDDLISRKAAIKAIDDLPNCYNGYSDTYDKAYIIGVLEELPTIDVPDKKVGKWTPVSEGLPEVGRNVLMSVGKGMYTAEGFLKGNGKWAQYRWSANLDNVDAWAEMPEPWKGEENV